ncbi:MULTISPECIES: GntR family transcriptional regulator [unclassified Aminobacter]|uniref:GntR family transcriptional regulator n=1 Tax=unclassified Aminobacter TaxID=2644704 RepID=UPI00046358A4|nr:MULTISPECIES: GntR family transcriptional regulator [unclassified Aminobacter]TWH35529.1 GntR family transcriptional regulator of vanillate catabolism [Aminobacter sp. J15]
MNDRKEASQTLKALMGIRNLVVGGVIARGERLSEVPLSERLGISRTPIRAALARLEQEGLLERIPSGGYIARGFSADEVIDSIEIRGVLEGTAARLAAERGVEPRKLIEISKVVEALDATINPDPAKINFERYVELNAEFHRLLSMLAGSETLRREIERATSLPFASPSAFLETEEAFVVFRRSLIGGQEQHRSIVQAIEMREGARAEAIAREHARVARQNLEYVLNTDKSLLSRIPSLNLIVT